MPTEQSHKAAVFTLNGERVTGNPEDAPPLEIDGQDLYSYTFGSDGTLYLTGTAIQGGEVTVTLGPSSPMVPKLIAWDTRVKRGETVEFEGSYGDPNLGHNLLMRGGRMLRCMPTTFPGVEHESAFVFEQLLGDFDGVEFASPPTNT